MNNETNERWVWIVPATPLLILLLAIISALILAQFDAWPMQLLHDAATSVLQIFFLLAPLVGAGMLACLFWKWWKKTITFKRSYLFSGIVLSVLDILIPLGILAYIAFAIFDRGLSF